MNEIPILDPVFRPVRDLANVVGRVSRGRRTDSPPVGRRSDLTGDPCGNGSKDVLTSTVSLRRRIFDSDSAPAGQVGSLARACTPV